MSGVVPTGRVQALPSYCSPAPQTPVPPPLDVQKQPALLQELTTAGGGWASRGQAFKAFAIKEGANSFKTTVRREERKRGSNRAEFYCHFHYPQSG